ncbi:MAG: hypothetical protein ABIQ04_01530 [Candidatus Saccharimonadales bacterium]
MNKQPYNTFDLPTRHLTSNDYVPPKARRSEEIERRHNLPAGTVLAEQQRDGLIVAQTMLENVVEPEDIDFVTNIVAMSGINTSWYSYGRGAEVMRRRLDLPTLASDDEDWRETREGLLIKAKEGLVSAVILTDIFARSTAERGRTTGIKRRVGRHMGNISLQLACVRLGNAPAALSAFDTQIIVRDHALETLEASRVMSQQIGLHPSIAQFADPDSETAIYLRRQAPNGTYDAYEQAVAELRSAA